MKIRHQVAILLAGIILLPMICIAGYAILHYMSSPQRLIIAGYRRWAIEEGVTKGDITALKAAISRLPPGVEVAVASTIRKGKDKGSEDTSRVVYSNISDIVVGGQDGNMTDSELLDTIRNSRSHYFYQISTVKGASYEYIVVTRVPKMGGHHSPPTPPRSYWIWVLVSIIVITEVFAIIMVLSIFRNITRSITILEERTNRIAGGDLTAALVVPTSGSNEIVALTSNLEHMRAALIEDSTRKQKLIMGLSHDLRTPVALIKGYAEGILDHVISGEVEEHNALELMVSKAGQLTTMIGDLINYVKLDSGDFRATLKTVPLLPILEEFSTTVRSGGVAFNRRVDVDIDIKEDIAVPVDRSLFTRVLENLYSNALRYTKEGDLISFIAQENNGITVSIADTGCGIAKDDIGRIFDPLYRGTSSRREEGYGIGLAVVKSAIEAMGWAISVDSTVGEGSKFTIHIPSPASNG